MIRKKISLRLSPDAFLQKPLRKVSLFELLQKRATKNNQNNFKQPDISQGIIQQKQLKAPIRDKSCECSICGSWQIKLIDKEQIININQHATQKRKKRLKKMLINSVKTIIQVNRFAQCGLQHFVTRLQRKMQHTKSLHQAECKQVQFIKSHYHIDLGNIIQDQTPKNQNNESLGNKSKIKKLHLKNNGKSNKLHQEKQTEHIDLRKYTARNRSNVTINQYIQSKLSLNLPPISLPQTARSYATDSKQFGQSSPFSRISLTNNNNNSRIYTRSISTNRKK